MDAVIVHSEETSGHDSPDTLDIICLAVMQMPGQHSVQRFSGHRLQRLDFAGRAIEVPVNATIGLAAHVNEVHRLVNLLPAANDDIVEVLETSRQIPLHEVVQPLTHQGVVLVGVKTTMVASDADKSDCGEMLTQLCDKLRNQFGHALDLLNNILLVGHSNGLMDVAGNLVAVCPDDAVLASVCLRNLDDTV